MAGGERGLDEDVDGNDGSEFKFNSTETIESKTTDSTTSINGTSSINGTAHNSGKKGVIRMNFSNTSTKPGHKPSHTQLLQEKVEIAKQMASQLQQSDDLMHSFDPYNTNTYKGIKLGDDVVHYETNTSGNNNNNSNNIDGSNSISSGSGVSVGFKKRKLDSKTKKRPVRQKLENEEED